MTKYKQEIRDEAFSLYAQEKSIADIGRILKISKYALFKWKKKDNWAQRLESVQRKTRAKAIDTLSDIKLRHMKICRAVQLRFAQQMAEDASSKIGFQDADRAMKHELLIIGEATDRVESNTFEASLERWKSQKKTGSKSLKTQRPSQKSHSASSRITTKKRSSTKQKTANA